MSNYYERLVARKDRIHVAGRTPMVWGPPGVGKSALSQAMIRREQTIFGEKIGGGITLSAVGSDATDYQGVLLPTKFVDSEGNEWDTTSNATPNWAVRAANTDGIFYVIFEETTTAPREVQAAWLSIIQDRLLPNGFRLPATTRFILIGNPPNTTEGADDLIPPLTNRLTHIDFSAPFEDWARGVVTNWGDDESMTEISRFYRLMVTEYLKTDQSLLLRGSRYGSDTQVDRTKGWPSMRSWESVAVTLAAFHDVPEERGEIIDGLVGDGNAAALLAFLDDVKMPTPEETLNDPAIMDTLNLDTSRRFVAINAAFRHAIQTREPLLVANMAEKLHERDRELFMPLLSELHTLLSLISEGGPLAMQRIGAVIDLSVISNPDSMLD